MNNRELAQLQLLASIDELVERLTDWSDTPVPWQPARAARALTRRLLARIDRLRLRIESPLVVAVFGGSGADQRPGWPRVHNQRPAAADDKTTDRGHHPRPRPGITRDSR